MFRGQSLNVLISCRKWEGRSKPYSRASRRKLTVCWNGAKVPRQPFSMCTERWPIYQVCHILIQYIHCSILTALENLLLPLFSSSSIIDLAKFKCSIIKFPQFCLDRTFSFLFVKFYLLAVIDWSKVSLMKSEVPPLSCSMEAGLENSVDYKLISLCVVI